MIIKALSHPSSLNVEERLHLVNSKTICLNLTLLSTRQLHIKMSEKGPVSCMLTAASSQTWSRSFKCCRLIKSVEETSAGCLPFKCQQPHYWELAWQRPYKDILSAVQTVRRQRLYKTAVATRNRSWVKENTSICHDNVPTNIRRGRKVRRQ